MAKYLILLYVLAAGLALPMETAMNSKINKVTGSPNLAAAISFISGAAVIIVLYTLGIGGRGDWRAIAQVPWWAWLSGTIGVMVVTSGLIALPMTSAGLVIAVMVFGQALASIVMDHFGWLEVKRVPISAWRIIGVILIFVGTLLMQSFKSD